MQNTHTSLPDGAARGTATMADMTTTMTTPSSVPEGGGRRKSQWSQRSSRNKSREMATRSIILVVRDITKAFLNIRVRDELKGSWNILGIELLGLSFINTVATLGKK